jgi:hypothetical protein
MTTTDTASSLTAKLGSFAEQLDPDERVLLRAILTRARADGDDVQGFEQSMADLTALMQTITAMIRMIEDANRAALAAARQG